ncbi:MAG: VCBS repeat-containing protein [Verrucomicrobia bacterium]|nr:VCBS repeat-containing protein [Verrucomicrobiota bacterium]
MTRTHWPLKFFGIVYVSLTALPLAWALDWQSAAGHRSAAVNVLQTGKTGFTLLPAAITGIQFSNQLSEVKAAENQIRLNGSGVALGDIDGDGRCDIYLCRLEGGNVLYRNLGDWKFAEVPFAGGADCANQFSTGAVFADVDGDGDLDLLVNGIGTGTRLFFNDGKGNFTEDLNSGLLHRFGATTLALADVDGDGDLDLYVANYRTTTIRTTGFAVLDVNGRRMIRPEDRDSLEYTPEGRVLEHGEPDIFYINDGHGHFAPVSWTGGNFLDEDGQPLKKPPFDWGLTAMFRDINGDGLPDLYVCNDFHSADRIWMNDGRGHFRALPRLAIRKTSTFSMAVDFGDINRDGLDDFFVADMLSPRHARRLMQLAASDPYHAAVGLFEDRPQFDRNVLQLNRGDGTYAEIAAFAGLEASDWTWSAILLDVDLDGYEDLLCATGHMFDTQDLDAEARIQAKGPWRRDLIPQKLLMFPRMEQAKLAFRNRRDLTFEEVSAAWNFNQTGVAHGMAVADLDNDGDLDVVVNNLNGTVGIYRNDSPAPRVAVRLKGVAPNTRGIGAKIKVLGGPVPQSQEMIAGGRYLAGDDAMRVFAAGNATNDLRVEVIWRSGKKSLVKAAKPNRIYEVDETVIANEQPLTNDANAKAPAPLFQDVSASLNHTHQDEPFDDFARQPLLPKKLSQLGPGVAWFDVDGDGYDDLIIGGGRGGRLNIFHNDGNGGFNRMETLPPGEALQRDLTGLVARRRSSGSIEILAGSANYEDGLTNGPAVRQFQFGTKTVEYTLPGQLSSTGPLALADVYGDGDLDLFVGGRVVPGRYPEPASSLLFRNENGQFDLDVENSQRLARLGLVSGAVFSDLNGDGAPDLILACEWGPVRVFLNERGKFTEATERLGLASFIGWWNGVTVGDFDGDGHMDIVASNWGWNSDYQNANEARAAFANRSPTGAPNLASLNASLLYYGDFDDNGTLDLIEARFDPVLNKIAPTRSLNVLAQGLPALRERFKSFAAYNEADVFAVVGTALKQTKPLSLPWLASTIFLNRGDHFEVVPLPAEAQFAPAFGVSVADFDGDGNEDVFLGQNFFPVQPNAARLDAGRGLLLRGDGRGNFSALSGQASGIAIYGEQRGVAVADFDGDGRPDLAVSQNGAATKLFRNITARPGLRVRLEGPSGNLNAVGAMVRLMYDGRSGPAREVHAGAGYWSQDSSTLVLGKSGEPSRLWVRWPGGKTTMSELPAGANEVTIGGDGLLRVLK